VQAFDSAEFLVYRDQHRRARQRRGFLDDTDEIGFGLARLARRAHASAHVFIPGFPKQQGHTTTAQVTAHIVVQVQIPECGKQYRIRGAMQFA